MAVCDGGDRLFAQPCSVEYGGLATRDDFAVSGDGSDVRAPELGVCEAMLPHNGRGNEVRWTADP